MAIGIDPTIDFAFKRLLGDPRHSDVTIHFLNAVLGGSPRITRVVFLNPILDPEDEGDKLSILDIRALDDRGRWLNIEVQTRLSVGLGERLTYYVSSLYVGQLGKGEQYTQLRPAICICVLARALFPDVPDLHLDFRLLNARTGLVLTNDLQVHLVELPKYNPGRVAIAEATPLEKWVYFLRFAEQLTSQEIAANLIDPEFVEAAGVLEMIARTPRERELYEARLKMERDTAAQLEYATAIGVRKGREEGRVQGEFVGRIRLLQQMLGQPESSSSELAGLSIEQLSELENRLRSQFREQN